MAHLCKLRLRAVPAGQKATSTTKQMAIFHLSVKTISRAAGRSAIAAAAYRAGCKGLVMADERTGEIHDYRRKRGVESVDLILPIGAPDWATDRAAIWNAAEAAETRKNSTVAREFEIALPGELSDTQRKRLAHAFARELVDRHGFAADVAIHAPGKGGDNRNHHAHVLCTTRRLTANGFGEKTRELDDRKSKEIDGWRARYAEIQNTHLRAAGVSARVDHRSLADQGIDREPTKHLGPVLTAIYRRGGHSYVEIARANERLEAAANHANFEQQKETILDQILATAGDLYKAIGERDQLLAKPKTPEAKPKTFEEMRQISRAAHAPAAQIWTPDDDHQAPDNTSEIYRP